MTPGRTPVTKETQPVSDCHHGNLHPKSVLGALSEGWGPIVKNVPMRPSGRHQSPCYKMSKKISREQLNGGDFPPTWATIKDCANSINPLKSHHPFNCRIIWDNLFQLANQEFRCWNISSCAKKCWMRGVFSPKARMSNRISLERRLCWLFESAQVNTSSCYATWAGQRMWFSLCPESCNATLDV